MMKMMRNVLIGGLVSAFVVPKIMNMRQMSGMKKMIMKKARMLGRTSKDLQKTAFKTFRNVKSIMA